MLVMLFWLELKPALTLFERNMTSLQTFKIIFICVKWEIIITLPWVHLRKMEVDTPPLGGLLQTKSTTSLFNSDMTTSTNDPLVLQTARWQKLKSVEANLALPVDSPLLSAGRACGIGHKPPVQLTHSLTLVAGRELAGKNDINVATETCKVIGQKPRLYLLSEDNNEWLTQTSHWENIYTSI